VWWLEKQNREHLSYAEAVPIYSPYSPLPNFLVLILKRAQIQVICLQSLKHFAKIE
jgi:hypothetical protein